MKDISFFFRYVKYTYTYFYLTSCNINRSKKKKNPTHDHLTFLIMHTQSLIPPLNLRQNKFKSGVRSKLSSASATKNKGNLVKKYGELQCQRQRQSSWSASCSSPLIFQDLSFVCGSFLDVFFSLFFGWCRGSG